MSYIGNQSGNIVYMNLNRFRGTVADLAALTTVTGASSGDMYKVEDSGHAHMYDGTQWVDMGPIVGPQGVKGTGITSIVRTSGDGSEGTIDTYTITFEDTSTSTFEVRNGSAGTIDHIAKTGTVGTTDTYTAYADAAKSQLLGSFEVYNGVDGISAYEVAVNNGFVGTEASWLTSLEGQDGVDGKAITSVTFTSTTDVSGLPAQSGGTDTYTINYSDTTTSTYDVYNGADTTNVSVIDDVVSAPNSTWSSEKIAQELAEAGEVEEAPVNGTLYARKDADWVEIENVPTATTSTHGTVQLNNTLTSASTAQALTALQGKNLKDAIDNITVILNSDDTTLDELQEIVDYIKQNRQTLDALGISNIAGLENALASKQNSLGTGTTSQYLRGDGTWVTPPNTNTTYTEITDAEIDAGTATTLRTITGRRVKYALDKKADTGTQVIAGTGLSGGGTLAANRTLSVNYGTAAGTAAQGNDSRLSNSREWTAATITQAEAEAGTATARRAWTAQRVRQAILGWWSGSAEKTKLDGIEEGATNIPRITGSLTVTVGSGGTYPKISNAIDDLIKRKKVDRYNYTTIQLLPGFVIDEQIIVRNTDLSWITLTSNDELITSTFNPNTVTGVEFGYGSGQRGVFTVSNGKLPLFYKFNYQPDVSEWNQYTSVLLVQPGGELNITESTIVCTGTASNSNRLMLVTTGVARLRSSELRSAGGIPTAVTLFSGGVLKAVSCNFRAAGSDEDLPNNVFLGTSSSAAGNIASLVSCQGSTNIAPNTIVVGNLVLSD